MTPFLRAACILVCLVAAWAALCWATGVPPYILPSPLEVAAAGWARAGEIAHHTSVTMTEIALGLTAGVLAGLAIAHVMAARPWTRPWLMPMSVASQAVPVFALAPILVLWLGYGMASKVAMTGLIVFFPVTAAAYDGLRRTPRDMMDAAIAMAGTSARAHARILWRIRWPMALPVLAPGLKTAAAISPIGAAIGEWVGASEGLGHAMLKANSRAEIDMMFACAAVLMALGVGLYWAMDRGLSWAAPWAAAKSGDESE